MGVNHYNSEVITILFLLCLWVQGIPWQLLEQINKLFFQMSAQFYSDWIFRQLYAIIVPEHLQ